jgi:uncharacterized integral membrane protein
MEAFFNSKWFLLVKGTLFAILAFLLEQEVAAEAAKASGQIVTTWDLPNGVVPALAMVYGLLQNGQKK